MKNRSLTIGLITLFITLSCEAAWDSYNYESGTDFSIYKTYAWHADMEGIFDGTKTTNVRNPENIQHVKNAVESELAEKGIQQVDRNEADIHLAFRGVLERVADVEVSGYAVKGHGEYGRGVYGSHLTEKSYDVATLFIDFIDAKENKLFWRGWATETVGKKVKEKKINRVVSNILKKYPPKKK